jgi:hypothetical protein
MSRFTISKEQGAGSVKWRLDTRPGGARIRCGSAEELLLLRKYLGGLLPERIEGAAYCKDTATPAEAFGDLNPLNPPEGTGAKLEAAWASLGKPENSGDFAAISALLFPNPQTHPECYPVARGCDGLVILYGAEAQNLSGGTDGEVRLDKLAACFRKMEGAAAVAAARAAQKKKTRLLAALCVFLVLLGALAFVFGKYKGASELYATKLAETQAARKKFLNNKPEQVDVAQQALERFKAEPFGWGVFQLKKKRDSFAREFGKDIEDYRRQVVASREKLRGLFGELKGGRLAGAQLKVKLDEYASALAAYHALEHNESAILGANDDWHNAMLAKHVPDSSVDQRAIYFESWFQNAEKLLGRDYYDGSKGAFEEEARVPQAARERKIKRTLADIGALSEAVSSRAEIARKNAEINTLVAAAQFDSMPPEIEALVKTKNAAFEAGLRSSLLEKIRAFSPPVAARDEAERAKRELDALAQATWGGSEFPAGIALAVEEGKGRVEAGLIRAVSVKINARDPSITNKGELERRKEEIDSLVRENWPGRIPPEIEAAVAGKKAALDDKLLPAILETIKNYAPLVTSRAELENRRRELEKIVAEICPGELPVAVKNALVSKANSMEAGLALDVRENLRRLPVVVEKPGDYAGRLALVEKIAGENPNAGLETLLASKKTELQTALVANLRKRLETFSTAVQDKADYERKKSLLDGIGREVALVSVPEDVALSLQGAGKRLRQSLADSVRERIKQFTVALSERGDATRQRAALEGIFAELPPDMEDGSIKLLHGKKAAEISAGVPKLYKEVVSRQLEAELSAAKGRLLTWESAARLQVFLSGCAGDAELSDERTRAEIQGCVDYLNTLPDAWFFVEIKNARIEVESTRKKAFFGRVVNAVPQVQIFFHARTDARLIYNSKVMEPSFSEKNISVKNTPSLGSGNKCVFADLSKMSGDKLWLFPKESLSVRFALYDSTPKIIFDGSATPLGLIQGGARVDYSGKQVPYVECHDIKVFSFAVEFATDSTVAKFFTPGISFNDLRSCASQLKKLKSYSQENMEKAAGIRAGLAGTPHVPVIRKDSPPHLL